MLNCLHENRAKLSPACRKEEIAISLMQSSNVELLPSLGAACKAERAEHCQDVRPGRARVLNCLLKNAEEVGPPEPRFLREQRHPQAGPTPRKPQWDEWGGVVSGMVLLRKPASTSCRYWD